MSFEMMEVPAITPATTILTSTGKTIDLLNFRARDIDITDIATALSRVCRFNGHTTRFYSVAEHSLLGAREAFQKRLKLEFLLHDAAEAYTQDLSSPLKRLLPRYREIQDRIDAVIRRHFGLPEEMTVECRDLDLRMLATERRDVMPPTAEVWSELIGVTPFEWWIASGEAGDMRTRFLEYFTWLQ